MDCQTEIIKKKMTKKGENNIKMSDFFLLYIIQSFFPRAFFVCNSEV